MPRSLCSVALLVAMVGCAGSPAPQPAAPTPAAPAAEVHGLANVQRTMRLLATSSPTRRHRVRILFYGQSITESAWSRRLEQRLRARFPHADLEVENRSLGGFAAQLLIRAAESDLYPFYPDLLILHVFGAHDRYQELLRRVRARTTAEVLHQTDHLISEAELREESDPAKLAPEPAQWSAFMNHAFLPSMVAAHQTALCDQRSAWKRHLTAHALPPGALLRDGVHLNAAGDVLMSDLVDGCLQYAPTLGPAPAEAWVQELPLGPGLAFQQGVLRLAFEGNRIDAITAPDASASAQVRVRIDDRPPSAHPALYAFTRAHAALSGKWPPVFDLSAEAPLLLEDWTLVLRRAEGDVFTFEATGSRTGPDGAGRTDQRFVSRSRRLVIDPDDWNLRYALELGALERGEPTPTPDTLTIRFRVDPRFTDAFAGAPHDPASERAVTLAAGLPNGAHVLTLEGAEGAQVVRALRVYRPPLSSAGE